MSSTELFRKHFGSDSGSVGLNHPNIESFFNELNEECLEEDRKKIKFPLTTLVGQCPDCGGNLHDGTGTGWMVCNDCRAMI